MTHEIKNKGRVLLTIIYLIYLQNSVDLKLIFKFWKWGAKCAMLKITCPPPLTLTRWTPPGIHAHFAFSTSCYLISTPTTQLRSPLPPHSTVHYSTVLYIILYCNIQYSTVLYITVLCNYSTVLYSTVQCFTVQYYTVQHSILQYSTVQ